MISNKKKVIIAATGLTLLLGKGVVDVNRVYSPANLHESFYVGQDEETKMLFNSSQKVYDVTSPLLPRKGIRLLLSENEFPVLGSVGEFGDIRSKKGNYLFVCAQDLAKYYKSKSVE